MGITIHYRGKIDDIQQVIPLRDELIDIAETMKWPYQVLDDNWEEPVTAKWESLGDKQEITGNLGLKGVDFHPHPDSERAAFYFDKDGNVLDFMNVILIQEGHFKLGEIGPSIKTQFAPPDIHMAVIKLLKYIKKQYISDLTVVDEGSYWETESKDVLVGKLDFLNLKIDQVGGILNSIPKEKLDGLNTEQTADLIEKILTEKLNLRKK